MCIGDTVAMRLINFPEHLRNHDLRFVAENDIEILSACTPELAMTYRHIFLGGDMPDLDHDTVCAHAIGQCEVAKGYFDQVVDALLEFTKGEISVPTPKETIDQVVIG